MMLSREKNHLVGLGDLLKFCLGFLLVVRILVRVPLHGKLPVGLLEVVLLGALVDAQNLVVVDAHFSKLPSSSSLSRLL